MATFLLAVLFVVMIAAPCVIAMKTSQQLGGMEDPEEMEEVVTPASVPVPAGRPASLRQIAAEAEVEATMAQQRASHAHRAALMATARAAALRADVAAEVAAAAGRAAQNAILVAEQEVSGYYLPETHPSLDFPRAKATPRRAA